MDRRTSRDEQRVRQNRSDNNPNVFDDEYAADLSDGDDFVGVSDGFRPQPAQPRLSSQRDAGDAQSTPRRVLGSSKTSDSQPQRAPPRSSIAKGHAAQGSLTIANDGSNDPFADPPSSSTAPQRPTNAAQALMHRASVASTSSFATSGARTLSLAGPSHPYAMYYQGTGVARTSSTTTSSTQQPSRRSVSLERPQHPYGMYPQSPIDDSEHDIPPLPGQAITVGFPGLVSAYHRQIGPDGEEQDIIGPDGHTEQLPPYSRYPEEGATKESMAASAASAASAVPVAAPAAANGPQGNSAPASDAASDMSISQVERTGSQASPQSDKNWNEKSWSEKRKTRIFCGRVPLWLVLVLIALVMVFAVILGAAIGAMLAKAKHNGNNNNNNKHDNTPQAALASQTFSDASPIPAPTGVIPAATGFFQLSLDTPEETQRNCITDPSESAAWSCQVSSSPAFFNLTQTPNGAYLLNIGQPGGGNDYVYGVQVPTLPPQNLDFAIDEAEPNRGPALHFQTLYNKLVVLPVSDMSAKVRRDHRNHQDQTDNGDNNNNNNNNDNNNNNNNGNHKNGNNSDSNMSSSRNGFKMPGGFRHRFEVQQGDVAWFCFWNATFIEGFFYIDQNSSYATQTGSYPGPTQSSQNGNPSNSIPTTLPSSTSSPTGTSSGAPQSTPAPNRRSILAQLVARNGGGPPPPNYPRAIKVTERRIPPVPQAVCQQMRMDALGPIPVLDGNNEPITKNLTVTDPSLNDFLKGSSGNHRLRRAQLEQRDDPSSACLCQWISQ